jgi:hypothetical protein
MAGILSSNPPLGKDIILLVSFFHKVYISTLTFGVQYSVNDPTPFVVQAPFGGVKESGMGREGGRYGLSDYLDTKMVSVTIR